MENGEHGHGNEEALELNRDQPVFSALVDGRRPWEASDTTIDRTASSPALAL